MSSSEEEQQPTSNKSLGDILKKARKSFGLDLETLCAETKLNKSFMTALENNDWENLPVSPYVKAFLITLSKRLKLDPNEIITLYGNAKRIPPRKSSPEHKLRPLIDEAKIGKKAPIFIILGVFIFLLIILFNIQNEQVNESGFIETISLADTSIPESSTNIDTSLTPLPHIIQDSSTDLSQTTSFPAGSILIKETDTTLAKDIKPIISPKSISKPPPVVKNKRKNKAVFVCLIDSLWMGVHRNKQKDINKLLIKNQNWTVKYHDTLIIKAGRKNGLDIFINDKTIHPKTKKFKIINGVLVE